MFYLHDEPRALRIAIRGRLTREDCRDLEDCRATAESIRKGRPLIVETDGSERFDEAVEEFLDRLRAAGAVIVRVAGRERRSEPWWRRFGGSLVRQWSER